MLVGLIVPLALFGLALLIVTRGGLVPLLFVGAVLGIGAFMFSGMIGHANDPASAGDGLVMALLFLVPGAIIFFIGLITLILRN